MKFLDEYFSIKLLQTLKATYIFIYKTKIQRNPLEFFYNF